MLLMPPMPSNDYVNCDADMLGGLIGSLGTTTYEQNCLQFLDALLDVEHWGLYRKATDGTLTCVATASRQRIAAAKESVADFVASLHNFDPAMIALKRYRRSASCLSLIQIGDIEDDRYRRCFERANVYERLSFACPRGAENYHLSIYRGRRRANYSLAEMERFTPLARLVISATLKHERTRQRAARSARPLDIQGVEQVLSAMPLSLRERQVCSRAALGMSIEGTALDLEIEKCSVITYRHRAYKKLNISHQNELVAMVLKLYSA